MLKQYVPWHLSIVFFFCSSDLNQDSLDGAQATVSDVGSAEEFEKETTEDTPSGSHGEAEGNDLYWTQKKSREGTRRHARKKLV